VSPSIRENCCHETHLSLVTVSVWLYLTTCTRAPITLHARAKTLHHYLYIARRVHYYVRLGRALLQAAAAGGATGSVAVCGGGGGGGGAAAAAADGALEVLWGVGRA